MSLAAFAVNADEDAEDLTAAEVAERLNSHGLNLMKLDALTVKKVRKLRAQLERAQPRGWTLDHRLERNLLVARKTEGQPDSEPASDTESTTSESDRS